MDLGDLTEDELKRAVLSARSTSRKLIHASDDEVVKELMAIDPGSNEGRILASCCTVKKILLQLVRQDGEVMKYVPERLRSRDLCVEAMRSGGALDHVPEPHRNREMCLEAIMRDGENLEHVPEPMRDLNMCLAAVSRHGGAMRYVPEDLVARILDELGLD